MPLPVLEPLHLGATTVLLLVGIVALFLALQRAVVRRAIKTILSSAPAQPGQSARPDTASATPAPPPAGPAPPPPA